MPADYLTRKVDHCLTLDPEVIHYLFMQLKPTRREQIIFYHWYCMLIDRRGRISGWQMHKGPRKFCTQNEWRRFFFKYNRKVITILEHHSLGSCRLWGFSDLFVKWANRIVIAK